MRHARFLAATLTAIAVALPGCLAPGATPEAASAPAPDAAWSERAIPFGEGHDHADPTHHADLTTPNFRILAHDPLISETYGRTAGGHLCGDASATADGRRLAVVESRHTDVGFALADVTDPANPRWLGEFLMPTTRIYDLAVVPDGKHVVLVTSEAKAPADAPGARVEGAGLQWRDACGSGTATPVRAAPGVDLVPRPQGLILVSIEDPREPVIVDHKPLPGHGHSVFATDVDGTPWVLASSVARVRQGSVNVVTAHGFFQIYAVAHGPTGAHLAHVSTFSPPRSADPAEDPVLVGHNDGWIARHPATGQLLGYFVQWDLGLFITDLDDPGNPKLVGRWSDWAPEREGWAGNLHSVLPLPDLRNGRHYTLVGPEHGGHLDGHPTGVVWVLDTTDPTKPVEVAGWTLPHDVEWSGAFMFSNHYLAVHEDTAFVSMYHGGLWALDLSSLGHDAFTRLPSVGVFVPTRASPAPPQEAYRWAPTVEEVFAFPDGSLVTFDSNSGLYVLAFDATAPAPAPEPWPIRPVSPVHEGAGRDQERE